MRLVLFLLFSSLLALAADTTTCTNCDDTTYISGAGAVAPSAMIKQWAFSFSLLKKDVKIDFVPSDALKGFTALLTPCRKNYQVDFVSSDLNSILIYRNTAPLPNTADALVLPFFAGAVGLTYNLGNYSATDPQLEIPRSVLLRIFNGTITNWDHKDILAVNSGLASKLAGQKITLILQQGEVGATASITGLLQRIDLEQPGGNTTGIALATKWTEARFTNYTNVKWQPNAFAMVSTVLTTPYSLAYAPLSYIDQAGLPYAKIRNKLGEDVAPESKALAAALSAALQNTGLPLLNITNQHIVDANGTGVYPLTSLLYLSVHTAINTECELRRDAWKFFNWILSSEAAQDQILGSVGFGPFDATRRMQILSILKNVSCAGDHLLDYEFTESGSTFLRQAAISISAILLTIVVLILATLGWKRNNAITRAAGLAFATCFLMGCALNYLSVFVWAMIPNTQEICSARYILTATGYTLVLGAMFAKCWEIQKIFARAKSGDISPIQELPWWKFCRVFFSVVGINALFLCILGSIDPPKSMILVSDPLELKAYHMCYVYKTVEWAAVEFSYFSLLVVWGGYLAWKTRDIWERYNYPNESRSILLSIYNLIFCLTILIPLTTILQHNIEAQFFLTCVAVLFPTSFALFSVYGPKMAKFLGSSFGKRSKGSAGTGATGAKISKQQNTGAGGVKGPGDKPEENRKRQDTNKDGLVFIEEDPKEPSTEDHHFSVQNSPPQSPGFPARPLGDIQEDR